VIPAAYPATDTLRTAQPITPQSIPALPTQPSPSQLLTRSAHVVPRFDRLRGGCLGCSSLMQLSD
jgi:hypothetical protein